MKRAFQVTLALTIAFATLAPSFAQDAVKKGKKGKGKKERSPSAAVMQLIKGVELTAEQKPKVEALAKEWGPKLQATFKKRTDLLTAEQKKAQNDARKAGVKDGKKGKDLQKLVTAAVSLTEEQKTKMATASKAHNELRTSVLKKISELLTDEQKAKIPALNKKAKGAGKKKKKKKDTEDK